MAMLAFSVVLLAFTVSVMALKVGLIAALSALGLWIATRPEPRASASLMTASRLDQH